MSLCTTAALLQPGPFLLPGQAQGADRPSLAGEQAAAYLKRLRPEDYDLRWGEARFQTEGSLGIEYNDNVFLSDVRRQSDLILRPEVTLRGFWPVTELNTLNFSVGIGYNYYCQTPELDANRPEINPGTELAFTVFTGDVRLRLFDRFEYQDTIETWTSVQGSGPGFISLSNVQLFSRLDNQVGLAADWDLNQLILTGRFTHDNFVSFTPAYDYLTRASELLTFSAMFLPADKVRPGFEIPIRYDDYRSADIPDVWRVAAGPVVEVTLTPNFNLRAGAGVQSIQFTGNTTGTDDVLDYDAYLRLNHRVNAWMRHSLVASHLNLPGWNAGNTATTTFGYRATFSFLRYTTLSADLSWNRGKETGGLYQEDFDYILAGLRLEYQFNDRGTIEGYYGYVQKTSNQPLNDYTQNRVGLRLMYRF
jgi:hypothetical protein